MTSNPVSQQKTLSIRMDSFSAREWGRLLVANQNQNNIVPMGELCQSSRPLFWGLPTSVKETSDVKLGRLARLHAGKSEPRVGDLVFFEWFKSRSAEERPSLETLCCAQGLAAVLHRWVGVLDCETGNEILDQIQNYACQCLDDEDRLLGQMANEVLVTLGYHFSDLENSEKLLESASQRWLLGLQEMLDSDGAVQSKYCFWQPTLLATWTRVHLMATQNAFLDAPELVETWEWFVRYSLRLLRKNGTSLLSNPDLEFDRDLYQAAVSTSSDREDRAIAKQVLPRGASQKKVARNLTEVGLFSEWAGLGVMQQDWSPSSPRLAVSVHQETMQIEITRGVPLLSINQFPNVSVNGKDLSPVGDWDEVATLFDEDLDYIEMEIALEDGVRLQRQLLFLHRADVIMIADAVFADVEQRLDYQNQIQVDADISHFQETENQEIYLQQKKICGLVLPLALSEWKKSDDSNLLVGGEGEITLRQANYGKTLYAPLMLVADPKASLKPRTWRRLTVAEKLNIVEDDIARAYRVRIGDQQWVIYKSFAEPGNRTFLGQNHHCDFFMGRFQEDGHVEELISLDR